MRIFLARGYRLCNGSNQQVVAEHIFVLEGVSLRGFGIVVVHRAAERDAGFVGAAAHGVDVRHQGIAAVDNRFQPLLHGLVERPRLFVEGRVLGAV